MQRLLLRRTLRDLRSNAFRYSALFLLIVLCMFIVISIVASAESVISTVDERAEANLLEDGQFGVYIPLTDSVFKEIEDMGITLEEQPYVDFRLNDESTLRLMKIREKINIINLSEGRAPEQDDEIAIERLYAAAHSLGVGSVISVGGKDFTVCGICTSADYDLCLQNMSDMSADGNAFGTGFVTANAYNALAESGKASHAEEVRYSYLLGENASGNELKDYLLENKISTKEVEDQYFQDMLKEETQDRDDITDGIQELVDGSQELVDAFDELDDGAKKLNSGIKQVYDGLSKLDSESGNLTKGSSEVLKALKELESNSGKLAFSSDSLSELKESSSQLLSALQELEDGMDELENQVKYSSFESIVNSSLSQYGMDSSNLSADAQVIMGAAKSYLDEVNSQIGNASDGAGTIRSNFKKFDEAIASLPAAFSQLSDGLEQFGAAIGTLRSEYETLNKGVADYTEGVSQIFEGYDKIKKGANSLKSGTSELSDSGKEFDDGIKELQTETQDMLDEYFPLEIENLTDFVPAADNPRIKAANGDVEMNISIGMLAGVILLVLIAYVISVFVVHSIEKESAMIGTLYALGLNKKQLMLHYTILPVILCFAGGAVGALLGFSDAGISMMSADSYGYFSIPEIEIHYSAYLLVYGLVMPGAAAFIVNRIVIRKRLSRTALSLLKKEEAAKKVSRVQLKKLNFARAFQVRQFLREKRSCFAVMAGMFVSLLVLVLGLNCYVLCQNVKVQNIEDTKYTYMYQYKYPEKKAPEGGHAAYIEGLKKEVMGYDMEISIIGVEEDNPFFPSISSGRKSEISISSSVAVKYGLEEGDELIMQDEVNEKVYGFTVKEIVPYSVGLTCFMDIDSMRELFDREDDYYNVVYSDRALDVDAGRLYSVSTKDDVEKSADVFINIMASMIVMMTGAAIIIFLIVMYQMIKVMIDKSAQNISLMKIFGYRNREVRKLYLDGNFLMVALGALILIPIAKLIMDAVYPNFVANVACGIDLTWPPALYAIVYIGILACYLLIQTVLMRRLKKLSPADVLKDRE